MAHEAAGASGKKVKLGLTIFVSRGQAERLTARAIREGKNLAALVAEILEADSGDLELLERAGVVSLESPSAKSQVRAPRVAYDRVEIRLEL
jgi:predicted transcriptional regulator